MEKPIKMNIFELFEDIEEYPQDESLRSGLKQGVLYDYVLNTYVDGLINYLGNYEYGIHYERYRDCMPKLPEKGSNFKFRSCNDDTMAIFKDAEDLFFIHYDWDVSDCCIGWLPKGITLKQAIEGIKEYMKIETGKENGKFGQSRYIEIPKDYVTGWISF